jgi:hypothetical protein
VHGSRSYANGGTSPNRVGPSCHESVAPWYGRDHP